MRRSRHPIRRDWLRTYLARSSVYQIIALFIVIVFLVAFLNGVTIYLANFDHHQNALGLIGAYTLDGFIAVLGGSMTDEFDSLQHSRLSTAILKTTSVLLPTLFLGAVVYKVLRPYRRMTIFPRHFNLDSKTSRLETAFYLVTDLDVFDIRISAHAKYYKPEYDDGEVNSYPLKAVKLKTEPNRIPLPFSRIPTRVSLPVTVNYKDNQTFQNFMDGRETESASLTLIVESVDGERHIVGAEVDGQSIDPDRGEFCEILITVEGKIPQAQIQLLECESFDLFADVQFGETPSFRARFENNRSRYVVDNWDRFDE